MEYRLSKLQSFFSELEVDAVFVSTPVNIRYLTGHLAEDAWLLITRAKTFYITDFRYIEHVKKVFKARNIDVIQFEESLFKTVVQLAASHKVKVFGFEENHLTCYQFGRLRALAGKGVKFKGLSGAVEALRVVKEAQELDILRQAIRINLKGFSFIKKFICPGVSEEAVLFKLQDFIRREGVAFSFPPIIASGPNAAYPHARVSGRELKSSEPLLLDLGVEVSGYKSDLTRMFFLGKMSRSFEQNLSAIHGAQEAAYKVIRAGVEAKVVDAAARGFLEKKGLAQYFGHSLGHGVGLDTHEMPRISGKSGEILLENMVITVEPGVYFPGRYGVREEEMVLVTKNGCEVLSGYRDH
ncbi:MAG: aminopeptidase P family protein [Candidatus Omnitrophica bacterium]|nr:aminopeptidase P family protein [Candidatus Omnitrophota bacterium]